MNYPLYNELKEKVENEKVRYSMDNIKKSIEVMACSDDGAKSIFHIVGLIVLYEEENKKAGIRKTDDDLYILDSLPKNLLRMISIYIDMIRK